MLYADKVLVWAGSDTAAKVPTTHNGRIPRRHPNPRTPLEQVHRTRVNSWSMINRDCAALVSNGEYLIADGGVEKYQAYIDSIKAVLTEYSDIQTILVIGDKSSRFLVI